MPKRMQPDAPESRSAQARPASTKRRDTVKQKAGEPDNAAPSNPTNPSPPAPTPSAIMPPVPYTITSKRDPDSSERATITTMLAAPTPDDECPLTLEPIATSGLSFLPDCPFLDHAPLHRKMTLPCGHSFSAVPLLYHMCKNSMTCPCCRSGPDRPADFACIPAHFREQMSRHILSTSTAERREEERESVGIVVSLRRTNTSFVDIANRGELSMTLTFFNPDQDPRDAIFQFSMSLAPFTEERGSAQRTVFRPTPSHMRMLAQITGLGTQLAAMTTISIPNIGDLDIERVQTQIPTRATDQRVILRGTWENAWTRISVAAGNRASGDQGVSTFELGFGEDEGSVFINYVSWRPDMTHINWGLRID